MAEEEVKTYNTAEKGFATRCSMHTHGTFSTPSYGGVGEPYRKDKEHDPRAQGLQFTTNKQRAGQTGANWNNNNGRRNDHKILFEVRPTSAHSRHRSMLPTAASRARSWQGEPYVDPGKHEREHALAQEKKRTGKGWFPPALEMPIEHHEYLPDGERPEPKPPKAVKGTPQYLRDRGVKTAPSKRGCVGTPKITIAPAFESMPDEYQPARELDRDAKEKAREKIEKPFKGRTAQIGNNCSGLFDENIYAYEPGDHAEPEKKARSISHWSPYDRVGVVNAIP